MLPEVQMKIKQCIAELEPYRIFSSDIEQAIGALKEIENLTSNPNRENLEKALEIVTEFYEGAEEYSSYIPTTISNLGFVRKWLEKTIK